MIYSIIPIKYLQMVDPLGSMIDFFWIRDSDWRKSERSRNVPKRWTSNVGMDQYLWKYHF